MRFLPGPALALLVLAAIAGAAARAEDKPEDKPHVLYDFAVPLARTMSDAEAKPLLALVFPKHLSSLDACKPTAKHEKVPGHMEKSACFPDQTPVSHGEGGPTECMADIDVPQPELDRSLGNLVPSVVAFAKGSFTRAHADEIALWVMPGYCSDPHRYEPLRLVIASGDKVVLDVAHAPDVHPTSFSGYDFLGLAAVDADDDGQDDLLVEAQYYATMDITRSDAYLLRVHAGRLDVVAEFPGVFETRCETYYEPGERYKRAAVLRFVATPSGPRFIEPGVHDLDCDKSAPR